eukprot:CAMPEP_0206019268 /NCGR_PEP_ID=MMETSP1464-20131121/28743_1 /ASSEMBLY_ACC=CAM_ASM_001124 /TAXON_ID=119497 /ORGANISM="Exanthemachrysis gayraliae, Strain RCC1523" /LENGTH=367 /DNA_ID=CAMNT_0053393161 /DNA_START=25 /DNA_END=1128 /DNA_ORIENTATION=-
MSPFVVTAGFILCLGLLCCFPILSTAGVALAIQAAWPHLPRYASIVRQVVVDVYASARHTPLAARTEDFVKAHPTAIPVILLSAPALLGTLAVSAFVISVLVVLTSPILLTGGVLLLSQRDVRARVWANCAIASAWLVSLGRGVRAAHAESTSTRHDAPRLLAFSNDGEGEEFSQTSTMMKEEHTPQSFVDSVDYHDASDEAAEEESDPPEAQLAKPVGASDSKEPRAAAAEAVDFAEVDEAKQEGASDANEPRTAAVDATDSPEAKPAEQAGASVAYMPYTAASDGPDHEEADQGKEGGAGATSDSEMAVLDETTDAKGDGAQGKAATLDEPRPEEKPFEFTSRTLMTMDLSDLQALSNEPEPPQA